MAVNIKKKKMLFHLLNQKVNFFASSLNFKNRLILYLSYIMVNSLFIKISLYRKKTYKDIPISYITFFFIPYSLEV